jgi:hypothetical protein
MVVTDLSAFIETIQSRGLFEPGSEVIVTRAPGRLDVMGGIADYSGSLVLQRTIAEATFAALQVVDEPVIHVVSLGRSPYSIRLDELLRRGDPLGYPEARSLFHRVPEIHWAAYVIGIFLVLMRERGRQRRNRRGARPRRCLSIDPPDCRGLRRKNRVSSICLFGFFGRIGKVWFEDGTTVGTICGAVKKSIAQL